MFGTYHIKVQFQGIVNEQVKVTVKDPGCKADWSMKSHPRESTKFSVGTVVCGLTPLRGRTPFSTCCVVCSWSLVFFSDSQYASAFQRQTINAEAYCETLKSSDEQSRTNIAACWPKQTCFFMTTPDYTMLLGPRTWLTPLEGCHKLSTLQPFFFVTFTCSFI